MLRIPSEKNVSALPADHVKACLSTEWVECSFVSGLTIMKNFTKVAPTFACIKLNL